MDDPNAQATQQVQPPTQEDTLAATTQALLKKKQQLDQAMESAMPTSAISQAMALINPNSNDPAAQIGKAIKTPAYAGYCLQYVDDKQGNNGTRQPTAYADYQANAQSGNINTSDKIPEGARVYFAPDQSNDNMGHVGISDGNGQFTSATDNGVKTFKISDWEANTGQQFLGWAKTNG